MKESVIEETTPYKLEQNHSSILTIVDEWYGKGLYSRKLKLPGGLEMLEETQKHSWRTHFDTKEQKMISRIKAIIKSMTTISDTSGIEFNEVKLRMNILLKKRKMLLH